MVGRSASVSTGHGGASLGLPSRIGWFGHTGLISSGRAGNNLPAAAVRLGPSYDFGMSRDLFRLRERIWVSAVHSWIHFLIATSPMAVFMSSRWMSRTTCGARVELSMGDSWRASSIAPVPLLLPTPANDLQLRPTCLSTIWPQVGLGLYVPERSLCESGGVDGSLRFTSMTSERTIALSRQRPLLSTSSTALTSKSRLRKCRDPMAHGD